MPDEKPINIVEDDKVLEKEPVQPSSSGTSGSVDKPDQVDQIVTSPIKMSLNDALDTEKPEIKTEDVNKDDVKKEDVKTVQVNLISSSGQENSPPDLNQDTESDTPQQIEPDFSQDNNFEVDVKIEAQQGMFDIMY